MCIRTKGVTLSLQIPIRSRCRFVMKQRVLQRKEYGGTTGVRRRPLSAGTCLDAPVADQQCSRSAHGAGGFPGQTGSYQRLEESQRFGLGELPLLPREKLVEQFIRISQALWGCRGRFLDGFGYVWKKNPEDGIGGVHRIAKELSAVESEPHLDVFRNTNCCSVCACGTAGLNPADDRFRASRKAEIAKAGSILVRVLASFGHWP